MGDNQENKSDVNQPAVYGEDFTAAEDVISFGGKSVAIDAPTVKERKDTVAVYGEIGAPIATNKTDFESYQQKPPEAIPQVSTALPAPTAHLVPTVLSAPTAALPASTALPSEELVSAQDSVQAMTPAEFQNYCLEYKYKFYNEYLRLKKEPLADTWEAHKYHLRQNPTKNRYTDVVCFDKTRVVLKDGDGGDYINANFVDAYKHPKGFICTQGPKEETIEDFWRMIYQERCNVILMVTKLEENNQAKCADYWPQEGGKSLKFGKIKVINAMVKWATEEYDGVILKLKHDRDPDRSHNLIHVIYKEWPDKGLPKDAMKFLAFLRRLTDLHTKLTEKMNPKWEGVSGGPPITIHCSAGIGRTGTLAAMYTILRRFELEGKFDVRETVRIVRQQRASMVQVIKQYVFLYLTVIEYGISRRLLKFTAEEIDNMWLADEISNEEMKKVVQQQVMQRRFSMA